MADKLPIYEIEEAILTSVRDHRRVIVSAPTGSGKSTQVPQMLLDRGLLDNGQVVVLQPRRLATRLLAARVAWERKTELGRQVGYQIRFGMSPARKPASALSPKGSFCDKWFTTPNSRASRR